MNKCYSLLGLFLIAALSGCSTQLGQTLPAAHYIPPNSNVESLGPTSGSVSRTRVFIAPRLTVQDIREVRESAVARVPAANALVNVREDATVTVVPLVLLNIITLKYEIEAEAVRVETGMQRLN